MARVPQVPTDVRIGGARPKTAHRAQPSGRALYGGGLVSGDVLDLILLALAAAFAVAGYRQGFIIGC